MRVLATALFLLAFLAATLLAEQPEGILTDNEEVLDKVHSSLWLDAGVQIDEKIRYLYERKGPGKKRHDADVGSSLVEVEIRGTVSEDLVAEIIKAGGVIIFRSDRFSSISAEIPPSLLPVLAKRSEIRWITPPAAAVTNRNYSQGRISHRVNFTSLLYPSVAGQGVKIGVLSDSIDSLGTVQASGDLPSVTVLPNQAGTGSGEGTAMLEIVYDLAPSASLYFATAKPSEAAFAQNILDLASAGCKVIIDDIVYLAEPVYQDGVVAQAVDTVTAQGVLYFSSAGNLGSKYANTAKTYEADYVGTSWVKPSGVSYNYIDAHSFGSLNYVVIVGSPKFITLHWSDPFGSPAADYDLFVTTSTGTLVGQSVNGGVPYEQVDISASGTYYVYIARYSGPIRKLSLRTFSGTLSVSTTGATFGHMASEGAISIAAIRHADTTNYYAKKLAGQTFYLESFSSDGPRQIFYSPNGTPLTGSVTGSGGVFRNKPDFTAADGVSTATPGFSTFLGTSAAAPHAGALAALAISAFPSLPPATIRQVLMATAIDILAPGYDTNSGYGIIDIILVLNSILSNECSPNPCQNGGECVDGFQSYTCVCPPLTAGAQCQTLTACSPNPCPNNGGCTASLSGYSCGCNPGCANSGTCVNGVCNCTGTGFTGPSCSTAISCASITTNSANYPTTPASTTANGTCVFGYTGSPTRACDVSGNWQTPSGTCTLIQCPAGLYQNANWMNVNGGAVGTGTCISGWTGSPKRLCLLGGTWNSTVTPSCTRRTCSSTVLGNATFPQTNSLTTINGTCQAGFTLASLPPSAYCDASGTWVSFTNPCQRITCPSEVSGLVTWPISDSQTTVTLSCPSGFSGSPSRTCNLNGQWSAITNPCQELSCPSQTFANAEWPQTSLLANANGTCVPGYAGLPVRTCLATGSWDSNVSSGCARLSCPSELYQNIQWPSTLSLTTGAGTCTGGGSGSPTRACQADGTWSATVTGTCGASCPAVGDYTKASWPPTAPGLTAAGTCIFGYAGSPTRKCLEGGAWASSVTNVCTRLSCPAGTYNYLSWPSTNSLQYVTLNCPPNFSGRPTRYCGNGTWAEPTNPCVPYPCASQVLNGITWPATPGDSVATGICPSGFSGSPLRGCLFGTWNSTIVGGCSEIMCPSELNSLISWPATAPLTTQTGTCPGGFSGSPTRYCHANGTWADVASPCQQALVVTCPATAEGNAEWPSASGSTVVSGTCVSGFAGNPTRPCDSNGNLGPISSPCVPLCPPATYSNANWTASLPDTIVNGTCVRGWTGLPTRKCKADGTWETTMRSFCTRIRCSETTFNTIFYNATNSDSWGNGICPPGKSGIARRYCSLDAVWGATAGGCS